MIARREPSVSREIRSVCCSWGGAAIDLTFGDCGQATFGIAREDLEDRNFERVAAVVEGH
ncbi:DUF1963 domain-containing protein [Xanthomonas cassavae CFBP 4642]|uniref:DUF1963 domain-containing protein n=1 Tax=Xanthomonas cassavae CFBP 4642 TaxID=1219375 RepID=A0ABS8HHV8_9XANT|nr:DUF1963 domain-containing protein [Xanthomonas cassavae CFBP 4642]